MERRTADTIRGLAPRARIAPVRESDPDRTTRYDVLCWSESAADEVERQFRSGVGTAAVRTGPCEVRIDTDTTYRATLDRNHFGAGFSVWDDEV